MQSLVGATKNFFEKYSTQIVAALLFAAYLFNRKLALQYPVFHLWDMDQTTVVDAILIESGLLPAHVHHPGFGMYIFIHWAQVVANYLGMLSSTSIAELRSWVSHILGVVELLEFIRGLSPILVLGSSFLQWRALLAVSPRTGWEKLLILVFFLAQSGLLLHSTMIRTELYAVFFWSAGHFLLLASLTIPARRQQILALLGAGFFLGLSFFSKVQAAPLLVFSLCAFEFFRGQKNLQLSDSPAWSGRGKTLSLASLVLAIAIVIGAYLRRPLGQTFTTTYQLNPVAILFLIPPILVFLSAFLAPRFLNQILPPPRARIALYLFLGVLLVFPAHFLVYSDPAMSFRYMMIDAKMAFFRTNFEPRLYGFALFYYQLKEFFLANPGLYLGLIGSLLVLLLQKNIPQKTRWGYSCLSLLAFLPLALGARPLLRDLIWAETTLVWMLACLQGSIFEKTRAIGPKLASIGLLILCLASQGIQAGSIIKKTNANNNLYGWWAGRIYEFVYGEWQMPFLALMEETYGKASNPVREEALAQAFVHATALKTANFVFQNAEIGLPQIGIAMPGARVWRLDVSTRILTLPHPMIGGILVDPTGLGLRDSFLRPEMVHEHWEAIDKSFDRPVKDAYALLFRRDLDIFLVAEGNLPLSLAAGKDYEPTGQVTLSGGPKAKVLNSFRLLRYVDIDREQISVPHFFVIRQRIIPSRS